MRVGILIRDYSTIPYETCDIHGEALAEVLNTLGHRAYLIYLNKHSKEAPRHVISITKAFFQKFDVVYASSPRRGYGILCVLFAVLKLKPLYLSIFDATMEPITKNPVGKSVFRMLSAMGVLKPFAVTRVQQDELRHEFKVNAPVLRPCLRCLGNTEENLALRAKQPTVLFAGSRDDKKRGLKTLLRVICIVKEKFPNIRLVVLNKYNYHSSSDWTVKLAYSLGLKENVVFKGLIKDMSVEYEKCWVYVLPFEGFTYCPPVPFTILEAMSYARPVISTDFNHIAEILPRQNLVPPSQPEELARNIQEALMHPKSISIPKEFIPKEVGKRFIELVRL